MNATNVLTPVEMYHFDGADLIVDEYQVINEMGLDHRCDLLIIHNNCKNDIIVSFDGVTDHDFIMTHDRLEIYTTPELSNGWFRKYANIYVRGPESIGTVYLSAYGHPNIFN